MSNITSITSKLNHILLNKHMCKLNAFVTIISFLLFLISIFLTKNNELNFEGFGLISSLPIIFIASIEILLVSSLISLLDVERNKHLLPVQTILLFIFLTTVPLLIEGTPRFDACFKIGGEVDYIVRNGYLNPGILRYFNWPAVDIFGAFILILMDLDVITLLSYTPLVSQIICLLLVFSMFNKIFTDKRKIWIALWIFVMANWLNQDFFSPQNGAFIVYLTILLCILLLIKQNNYKSSLTLTILILISSLVVYHILTPFVLGLNFFVLYIISKFTKEIPRFGSLMIVLAVFFLSWQVYGANIMLPQIVHSLQNSIYFDDITTSSVNLIMVGSIDHRRAVYFRLFCSILLYLMSLLGAFHFFIVEGKKSLISIIFLSLMISALGMFAVGGYGGEILIRMMLFSLLPIAYFISQNMDNKYLTILLIIFLLIFPTFHMISRYGNEQVDYTAPSDIKGSNFFFRYVPQQNSILSPSNEIFKVRLAKKYFILPYEVNDSFDHSDFTSNLYFCVLKKSDQDAIFFMNPLEKEYYEKFKLDLSKHHKIYMNREFYLYADLHN